MRVMIDTNVFVSSMLNPFGLNALAFKKAIEPPFTPLTCVRVISETHKVIQKWFPKKAYSLEIWLDLVFPAFECVHPPINREYELELKIRDPMDRPILRAVIYGNADIILTNDNDFLDSGITDFLIMSPEEFYHY